MKLITTLTALFLLQLSSFSTCIDSLLIEKYGMTKIYESNIAKYYALERDSEYVRVLDSTLQANHEILTNKFDYQIEEPIRIQIFPDSDLTMCICGLDTINRKPSNMACARYRKINLVSSYAKGYGDKTFKPKTIIHEYAHVVSFDMVGKDRVWTMPAWLREGVAMHANTYHPIKYTEYIKAKVLSEIESKEYPNVKKLHKQYATVKDVYLWSYLFSEYLIEKNGWEKFLDVMRDFESFPKNTGMTYRQLNKEWVQYLNDKPIVTLK